MWALQKQLSIATIVAACRNNHAHPLQTGEGASLPPDWLPLWGWGMGTRLGHRDRAGPHAQWSEWPCYSRERGNVWWHWREREKEKRKTERDGKCSFFFFFFSSPLPRPFSVWVTHLLKTAVSVLASTVRLSVSFMEPLVTVSVTRSPAGSSSASEPPAGAALGPQGAASSGHCSAAGTGQRSSTSQLGWPFSPGYYLCTRGFRSAINFIQFMWSALKHF